MGLKIWLPLTGHIRNQGVAQVTLASGTPTYTNGKLGQCLSTGTLNFNVANNVITTLGSSNIYSICCWCKNLNTSTSNRWVFMLSSGTGTARGLWEGNSTTNRYWAYSGSGINIATSINTIDGKWHHICFTSNKTNVKLYVDGIFQAEVNNASTTAMTNNTFQLNATDYNLNDFRVYDCVLSPEEIKFISQGLIAHYPLNRRGFGQNNLIITNSMTPLSGTSGWSSAGTNWSNTNVLSSEASNGHAIRSTYSGTTQVSGGIHHPTGVDKTTLTNGATYTLSARIRASKACIATFQNELMITGNTINLTTDWKIYSYSCTIDNTKTYHSNVIYVRAADATQNMWIECDWIKLEEGNKATPWIPNTSDPLYNTISLNSNIEYDCSGYQNNILSASGMNYLSDTPKYLTSTKTNGNTAGTFTSPISAEALHNEITIACWVKRNYTDTAERVIYCGPVKLYVYTDFNFRLSWKCAQSVSTYTTNTWAPGVFASSNEWKHIVFTFKNGIVKVYVNGKLSGTSDRTQYGTYVLGYLNTSFAANGTSNNFIGMLSDLRLYTTCLSDTAVESLYQNEAFIDSDNNVFGNIRV